MTRVRSAKTRQALLVLDGVFDADNPPERLSLFDEDGNQLDFSPAHQIPPGGTIGQVLAKDTSTDFDVEWVNAGTGDGAVIPGGTTGQVLAKASDDDGDVEWVTAGIGGGGGFSWSGPWEADDYDIGAVVRYNNGLWVVQVEAATSDDVPGSVDTSSFQDSSGDLSHPYDWKRLKPDEPQTWTLSGTGAGDGGDFFFFDVTTSGTLTIHKSDASVNDGWANVYYGSTGIRFGFGGSNPFGGATDYTASFAVGRYYVYISAYNNASETDAIEVIPDTAEIGEGGYNPWVLMLQGDPDYDYGD